MVSWSILIGALAAALFVYGWRPLQRWRYRHIPGPPPVWLVGGIAETLRLGFPQTLKKWADQYGPVYKFFLGGTLIVVVADAAAAKNVNTRNHTRSSLISNFSGKEGRRDQLGILFAEGPYWQALRQSWQALFHPDSLRRYTTFINASAERLVAALQPASRSGEAVEIWRMMGQLTTEVVGSSAFGVELNALGEGAAPLPVDPSAITFRSQDDLGVTAQKIAAVAFAGAGVTKSLYPVLGVLFPEIKPVVGRLAYLMPDKSIRLVLQGRMKTRELCQRLISEARRDIQSSGGDDGAPHHQGSRGLPAGAFVRHLLQADSKLLGRPFTDEEVAAQISTFLAAGYETTASALAFTVYNVAAHPAAEARLLKEVDAFGRNTVPTYDHLDKFPYLTACIDEALRLHPPGATGTLRTARDDCTVCGFHIPRGTVLTTAQLAFHHNPQYWEDPLQYRPERLLDGKVDQAANPAWAPFGDGGRSCVGVKLAYAEAKIALIRLYQSYTFRLTSGQVPLKLKSTITMSPAEGVHVTVHLRQ